MLIAPLSSFYFARSYYEYDDPDRDLYPAIAAIVMTHLIILIIVIWKYAEDFKAVFIDGTGDIPYDPD